MKPIFSAVVVAMLTLAGAAVVGCASNQNPPKEDRGATAGGNGAFGESPARPGSYAGDQYNQQNTAPTTKPSGY